VSWIANLSFSIIFTNLLDDILLKPYFINMLNIVIIGTGNAATVLGKKLCAAGHQIIQVYGRNKENAQKLAGLLKSVPVSEWTEILTTADIYLLAVADDVIEEVSNHLQVKNKILVHTAGSVSKNVLSKASERFGVLYPLQSLRKEMEPLTAVPLFIDASDEQTLKLIYELAMSISKQVTVADDMERMKLHVAAVFSNNFSNYMYMLAEQYCKKENLHFKHLLPLINETATKLQYNPPSLSQTGPASRGDKKTIQRHEELLNDYPTMKEVYQFLTAKISELNKEKDTGN